MASRALTGELSSTGKRWVLRECDEVQRDALVAAVGVSPIVARLLVHRGVATARPSARARRSSSTAITTPTA
jgi:hypothetical protein